MTGAQSAWGEYELWNDAIAAVIYPELETPEPVYMDFEDEVLEELGARLSVPADEVVDHLSRTVRATLGGGGPAAIFARHAARVRQWNRDGRPGPPPFLGVLAVFCLAAEQMAAGDGMSQANYFGRLRRVLGYEPNDSRIDTAYRRVAERFWGTLNGWLIDLDGRRGLPTAYALTHRYVGLTVSQALVRQTDRDRFNEFFRKYGFAPGSDVPPSELQPVLDSWFSQDPCPVSTSLQRLWKRGEARERIAQVAAVALAAWDGSVASRSGSGAVSAGHLALSLEFGGFPRKRLSVQALLYLPQASQPREGTILTATPETLVELVPEVQGALGLGRSSSLHPEDVLEGVLKIKDGLTGSVLERRPRRLVLFRQDEITRRWIESPQVQLGEHVSLLVHAGLVPRLERVLASIARPGWQLKREAYTGQPAHWVLVTDVEVFSHPGDLVKSSGMDDLAPLVPLTSSQLRVAGGFALPGQLRGKWHSWQPPEIRAVSDVPGGFEVRLIDVVGWDDETEQVEETVLETWDDESGVVVAPLSDLELEDGDYRAELVARDNGEVLTSTEIRLRSGDTPDSGQWAVADSIVQHPREGLGVLGCEAVGAPSVRGLVVDGEPGELRLVDSQVPERPWWRTKRGPAAARQQGPVRLTMPDPDSCIYTGAHKEQVETVPVDAKGKVLVPWYYGTCRGCGLVRRYSGRPPRSSYRRGGQKTEPTHVTRDLSGLAAATSTDDGLDWETAFDAVLHTGGGRWGQLERIALQVEPTALFVDQFARSLEALGHVEIRRDPQTLEPLAWEVAPTVLAGTDDGWLFSGYWPGSLWSALGAAVEEAGGELAKEEQPAGPASYFAVATDTVLARAVHSAGDEVPLLPAAWRALAAALPPLSHVVAALPRHEASFTGNIKWFNPRDNEWVPASDAVAVGGYRVTRFSTLDFVRTKADVDAGTMARSTVQLSKHVAAMLAEQPALLAYDPGRRELSVPLGADLPGLYGRAVVAASGALPTPDLPNRLLVYRGVPRELAAHIHYLLSN